MIGFDIAEDIPSKWHKAKATLNPTSLLLKNKLFIKILESILKKKIFFVNTINTYLRLNIRVVLGNF